MFFSALFKKLRPLVAVCTVAAPILIGSGCGATPEKKTAPVTSDFTLPDLDRQSVSLSDYLGKDVVLISFWASWCEPCRREMDTLTVLHNKYADAGLEILSVAIDDAETVGDASSYARLKAFPYKVLFDDGGSATGELNPGRTTPFSIIIDRNRQRVWEHQGFVPGDEMALEAAIVAGLQDQPDQ